MKARIKPLMSGLGVLLCCLIGLWAGNGARAAGEEKLNTLWLSVAAPAGEEMPAASVSWLSSGKEYCFCLPGGTDWEEIRVWFDGTMDALTINGASYHSGDRITGLSAGSELAVEVGRKTIKARIQRGSALGALFISTESGSLKKIDRSTKEKEPGALTLLRPDGSLNYDDTLEYVKTRGNTAPTLPKKNYGFKLAKGTDLLGLGKAKRWVLVGADRDHSLIRTQIVFDLARYAGLRWTPDCVPVDVYFNRAYHGCYLLTEKIEINENRVDVADLDAANKAVNPQPVSSYPMTGSKKSSKNKYKAYLMEADPEDLTGGYLIEYENYQNRYNGEPSAYTTTKRKVLVIKDPEYVSEAEMLYISAFMQGYENAVFAKDGVDPETGKRYDEFVDFESLVLKYMLEEISMNLDANASSQYYVKPSDAESKVAFAGPCWDYDMTFACFSPREFQDRFLNPESILHTKTSAGNYWWGQLYLKPEFLAGIREKWAEKYEPALRILLGDGRDPAGGLKSVAEYADALRDSAAMNFERWPIKATKNTKRTGLTFEDNITYLTEIISRRRAYLDSVWGEAR